MPWKVLPMNEIRVAFVHQVLSLNCALAEACRKFGISRKTGYKWLQRYRAEPEQPLQDKSRKPRLSPRQTDAAIEQQVLAVRRQYGWGPRKIHAHLKTQGASLPSIRTLGSILRRHDCVRPQRAEPPAVQFFERSAPNELWQCDHKGPLEIARQKVHPFTILDDHSRFLVALRTCLDVNMRTAWNVLWEAFGDFGMPDSVLCDNAFGTKFEVPQTLSWFDAQLLRLDIGVIHGRAYHPQTQGKVERLHGTLEREVWPFVRRDSLEHFQADVDRWRTEVYNAIRPHESLQDSPPLARYQVSRRPRPATLPEVEYPSGSIIRKVSTSGDVRFGGYRILAGRGLVGQFVRLEDRGHELALFYAQRQIRTLARDQLKPDTML